RLTAETPSRRCRIRPLSSSAARCAASRAFLTPESRVVVRAAVPRRRSPVSVTLLTLTPCRGAPHARLARPGEGRPARGVRTGTPGRDVTDGGGGALSGPGAAPDCRAAPDGGARGRGCRPVLGRERFVSGA